MSISSQIPPEPHAGEPLSPQWGAAIVRCLRALTPQPSAGTLLTCGTNGWTRSARHQTSRRTAEQAALSVEYYLHPHATTMPPPANPPEDYKPVPAWSVTPGHINGISPVTTKGIVGETKNTSDWAVPLTAAGYIYAAARANGDWSEWDDDAFRILFSPTILYENQPGTGTTETFFRIGSIVKNPPVAGAPAGAADTFTVIPENRDNLACYCTGYIFLWQPVRNYA